MATYDLSTQQLGPSARISTILLVVGAVLGVVGFGVAGYSFARDLSGAPVAATPGATQLELRGGTNVVYQLVGFGGGEQVGPFNAAAITSSQVTVRSPTGKMLPVESSRSTAVITLGARTYVPAVQFDVPSEGVYAIDVRSSEPGEVLVTEPLAQTAKDLAVWIAAATIGATLFIAGGVMLVVGHVRRRKAARLVYVPPPPPLPR